MCSWHDDITCCHSEETDDWYIDEGDLKDLAMNKITVDQTVQETIEISQLQHSDNVVNISVGEIVRVPQVQVVMKTDRDPTDADFRQNSWNIRIISASSLHLVTIA